MHGQSAYFTPGYMPGESWESQDTPRAMYQVHPCLNGYARLPMFFDLAPVQFTPQWLTSANRAPLSLRDIRGPAFHPPITTLRILHSRMPFWPVELVLPTEFHTQALKPPISLGDVLVSLHRAMHQRISAADWETLSDAFLTISSLTIPL
ncbi:hypothetical protein B0H13DRAFT_1598976 [Mycena leptocephala]|nr:hypothetical protein B0H13DRAFT_1598976 [Mycena leptocephala]